MNSNGDTPLHEAVNRIDLEIAEILLRNGSDVRIKSSKGYELLDSKRDLNLNRTRHGKVVGSLPLPADLFPFNLPLLFCLVPVHA